MGDKPKDAYDVVWLTDAFGLDQAAETIAASSHLAGPSAAEGITQLGRLFDDQVRDIESVGPVMYADFMEAQPRDGELRHARGSIAVLSQALAA